MYRLPTQEKLTSAAVIIIFFRLSVFSFKSKFWLIGAAVR